MPPCQEANGDKGRFFFYLLYTNDMMCVLIRITSIKRLYTQHTIK